MYSYYFLFSVLAYGSKAYDLGIEENGSRFSENLQIHHGVTGESYLQVDVPQHGSRNGITIFHYLSKGISITRVNTVPPGAGTEKLCTVNLMSAKDVKVVKDIEDSLHMISSVRPEQVTIEKGMQAQVINVAYKSIGDEDDVPQEFKALVKQHCGANRVVLVSEKQKQQRRKRAVLDVSDTCQESDIPCVRSEILRCLQSGSMKDVNYKCRFLQANNCWFTMTCTSQLSQRGDVTGVNCQTNRHLLTMTYCCTAYCSYQYKGTSCWKW